MKNTMKVLKWRLGKLPTPEEAILLVKENVITKEEARDILFNCETQEERDLESLKSEVVFLRKLVESLSTRSTIVEKIISIEKPFSTQPWFQPYAVWRSQSPLVYGTATALNNNLATAGTSIYTTTSSGTGGTTNEAFGKIKTF